MELEQQREPSQYEIFRQRVVTALTEKVLSDFREDFMLVTLDTLIPDHEAESRQLHPDTLRSLCIYAAVAAGENTDMAIGYTPVRYTVVHDKSNPYSKPEELTFRNEFLVQPRAGKLEQKTKVTREPVSDVDKRRRNSLKDSNNSGTRTDHSAVHIPPQQRGRKKTQIPGFVSRMTDRFGF